MTRTKSLKLITTDELYKWVTGTTATVRLKGNYSQEMLQRFMKPTYSAENGLLLDVRSCMEVERSGMILGAQVIPSYYLYYAFSQSPERFLENFGMAYPEKQKHIVCYADDGPRAENAYTTLSYLGFQHVRIYKEGIEAFRKAYPYLIGRLPVEQEEKK